MKYEYLVSGRRTGKTYAICKAAKEIGATVLCHSHIEAVRLKREYGVKTSVLGDFIKLMGTSGPYLIDNQAAYCELMRQQKEIQELQGKLDKIQELLNE